MDFSHVRILLRSGSEGVLTGTTRARWSVFIHYCSVIEMRRRWEEYKCKTRDVGGTDGRARMKGKGEREIATESE